MRESVLEFTSHLSPTARICLFVAGLVPLLAPYELLVKPRWNAFLSPFFFISLLISLGAIGITVIFLAAALVGLNEKIRFNAARREVTYGYGAPLIRWREKRTSFAEIPEVKIETQTWSDGPDTYRVQLDMLHGREIQFGRFATVEEAERTCANVRALLGFS